MKTVNRTFTLWNLVAISVSFSKVTFYAGSQHACHFCGFSFTHGVAFRAWGLVPSDSVAPRSCSGLSKQRRGLFEVRKHQRLVVIKCILTQASVRHLTRTSPYQPIGSRSRPCGL